jgi:hypothetical protein
VNALLPELRHLWWAIALPHRWPHPLGWATYAGVPLDVLPPIERELDDELRWLLREPLGAALRASARDVSSTTRAALVPARASR